MVVPHPYKFSVFFGSIDVAVGENVLHIYNYGLICGDVTLQIHETVARELQGVSETTAQLPHFKLKMHYQM